MSENEDLTPEEKKELACTVRETQTLLDVHRVYHSDEHFTKAMLPPYLSQPSKKFNL